jgi:site-specific DNA-cytosine methylase
LLTLENGLVFDNLLSELENLGYETRTFCLPACAVNAPHRRDRVWIVAHSRQFRERGTQGGFSDGKQSGQEERKWANKGDGFTDKDCHAADTDTGQRLQRHENETIGSGRERRQERGGCVVNVPNSEGERLEGSLKTDRKQGQKPHDEQLHGCCGEWNEPWLEVAARLCTLDDGLPTGLVRPKGWRVNSLKALGNAVVPQIPEILGRAIMGIEHET